MIQEYNPKTKLDCWYKKVCQEGKCGEDFCVVILKWTILLDVLC